MSEIFVSPGVFTAERDFSFYVSRVGQSSLGLIGETEKGPAFQPMTIENMGEFRQIFGDLDPDLYVPYVAKNWFKYGDSAIVCRVLGKEDIHNDGETLIYFTAIPSGGTSSQARTFATLVWSGLAPRS